MNDVNVAKNIEEQQTYNVEEVAAILRVSYHTALKIIKNGDIKSLKIGKQYRVTKSELNKLLQKDEQGG